MNTRTENSALDQDALRRLLLTELEQEPLDTEMVRGLSGLLDETPPQPPQSWGDFLAAQGDLSLLYPELEVELGLEESAPTARRTRRQLARWVIVLAAVLALLLGSAAVAQAAGLGVRDLFLWNGKHLVSSPEQLFTLDMDHFNNFATLLYNRGVRAVLVPFYMPQGYQVSQIVEDIPRQLCVLRMTRREDPEELPIQIAVFRSEQSDPFAGETPLEVYSRGGRDYRIYHTEEGWCCAWVGKGVSLNLTGLPSREELITMIDEIDPTATVR